MTLVGGLVLVQGFKRVQDVLAVTGNEITSVVGQPDRYKCREPGESSSAGQPRSRMDRPDSVGYAEGVSDDSASVLTTRAVLLHRDGDSLLGPGR